MNNPCDRGRKHGVRAHGSGGSVGDGRGRHDGRGRAGTHLGMGQTYPDLELTPDQSADCTRRAALLRFTSAIFSASFSPQTRPVNAAEFSESPVSGGVIARGDQWEPFDPAPTFYRPQEPIMQPTVTLENGQNVALSSPVIQRQTNNYPPSSSKKLSSNVIPDVEKQKETASESLGGLEVALFASIVMGGAAYSFSGRSVEVPEGSRPKIKVVMIEPEPYGLDKGRNYYRGIDIRQYCDAAAPQVTSNCVETIAGYLGSVASQEVPPSRETASAIVSYLDSLSSGQVVESDVSSPKTTAGAAFSTYLDNLSRGNIPAPSSPQSVASYFGALSSSISNDDYGNSPSEYDRQMRLSSLENRMTQLESSVNNLPDRISSRLLSWQQQQDAKMADEMAKIIAFLVNDARLQQQQQLQQPSNGINGNRLPL